PGTYELSENNLLMESCSSGFQNPSVKELMAGGERKVEVEDLPGYSNTTLTSEGVVRLSGTLDITFHSDGSGSLGNRLSESIPASVLRAGYYTRPVPALAPGHVYSFERTGWNFNNTPPGTPSVPGVSAAVDVLMQRMDSSTFAPYDPTSARWIIPDSPREGALANKPVSGVESRVLVVTARAPVALLQLPRSEQSRLDAQRLAQMRAQREVDLNQARASLRTIRQEIERIKEALKSRRAATTHGGASSERYGTLDSRWLEQEILNLQKQCRPLEQRIEDDTRSAGSPPETRSAHGGVQAGLKR
ncbi:MAG: hypothetical protein LC772_12415, partial [Chloroflexi bacterium]|nr:hypothetical protein [Chloroflexota bacterium]